MPPITINPSIIGRLQPAAGYQSEIPSNEFSSTSTTGHRLKALVRNSPRVRHRQLAWALRRCSADNWCQPASSHARQNRSGAALKPANPG